MLDKASKSVEKAGYSELKRSQVHGGLARSAIAHYDMIAQQRGVQSDRQTDRQKGH